MTSPSDKAPPVAPGVTRYVLCRDGKEVMRGSAFEVLRHLHATHSYSLDWALKHEGYTMAPESPDAPTG